MSIYIHLDIHRKHTHFSNAHISDFIRWHYSRIDAIPTVRHIAHPILSHSAYQSIWPSRPGDPSHTGRRHSGRKRLLSASLTQQHQLPKYIVRIGPRLQHSTLRIFLTVPPADNRCRQHIDYFGAEQADHEKPHEFSVDG